VNNPRSVFHGKTMEEMDFIFGRDKSNDNEEEETEEIKETEEPLTEEELEVLQKAGLRD